MKFPEGTLRSTILALPAVALLIAQTLSHANAGAGDVRILTENFKPINYLEDGVLKGIGAAIVDELRARVGHTAKVEVLPWKRAYNEALTKPDVGVYSMMRIAQREDKFHWVGPLYSMGMIIFARADNPLKIETLEDLQNIEGIALQAGGANHQMLKKIGVKNIVPLFDLEKRTQLLLKGRVAATISSDVLIAKDLADAGVPLSSVRPVTSLGRRDLYLGFGKQTPDTIINAWTEAFEAMKADGTLKRIREQYLPGDDVWNAPVFEGFPS
ncbi:MAG: ABC transporter substrate-binding protein [Cohaesibacteraceae bacterium]|nr:ABC transporter substrate-binding protein [Cohaesibacteraceae bacterium]